jgi:hypothetical protein
VSDADSAIAELDSALAEAGQDVTLSRVVAGVAIEVQCRANVRAYRLKEEDVVGGVASAVSIVSLSPTQIADSGWPGVMVPGDTVDPSIPRRNDKVIIDGRTRNVEAVEAVSVGNQVVRFNLSVM